jgi:hypothetical protein
MLGLDPRIHVFRPKKQVMDGRDKPGHDDGNDPRNRMMGIESERRIGGPAWI